MALRRTSGTVAAIDIGTTKVCTLIGDLDSDGQPRVLGVGVRTVERDWFKARLFLLRELEVNGS